MSKERGNFQIGTYIYISQEDKSRYFRIPSGSSFFNLENVSSLNAVDKYLTFFFFPNYDGIYIKIISSRSRVTNKFSSSRHRNPRFYFFFFFFFFILRKRSRFLNTLTKVRVPFPLLILVFFFPPFFPRSVCYSMIQALLFNTSLASLAKNFAIRPLILIVYNIHILCVVGGRTCVCRSNSNNQHIPVLNE